VSQLFDRWLREVLPLRVTPATVDNYTSVVDNHIKPALGRKRVSRLSFDEVQGFIQDKVDQGLAPRTVRLCRGLLVDVLNHAVIKGQISRNVAALTQGPGLTSGERRALTIDEAKALLKALDGERLGALYLLRLTTGIRPGEAFALPWTHVDLIAGTIKISRGLSRQRGGNVISDGKVHRKGWRTIPIPPPIVDALKAHLKIQEQERAAAGPRWQDVGLVFSTPVGTTLDPDNERKRFYELVDRAGLGHLTPNELRHSAASIMLAQGVPIEVVSEILGHTSIRITKDVYGHIGEKQRRGATEAISVALWT